MVLTSAGVSGAVMEPMRPIMEEKASRVCRYSVGYSSDVNRYSEVNTTEIPNLPSKNSTSRSVVRSERQMVATIELSIHRSCFRTHFDLS